MSGDSPTERTPHDAWMGRALLAFPPRWRDAHGAELIEVGRELSASDSSQRPPVRELTDVAVGGLTVRLRDRPPLWRRLLYYWAWRPVPRQYWGWMRDDLRSRFLGLRLNVRAVIPTLAIFAVLWFRGGSQDRAGVIFFAGLSLLVSALFAPRKARQFRERIHMRLGFDLTTWGVLPTPAGAAPAFPPSPAPPAPPAFRIPTPNARIPIRHVAWPLAGWSLVAGAALIGGAALPNTSVSFGPFSYTPDPNSPLTAAEVNTWSAALVGAASLLIGVVLALGRMRSRRLTSETVHPVNALNLKTRRMLWGLVSLAAVPALAVGLSGILPDLACAVVGTALALAGAGLLGLGLLARLVEPGLGRPVSVPDLIVGERWQRRWGQLAEALPA